MAYTDGALSPLPPGPWPAPGKKDAGTRPPPQVADAAVALPPVREVDLLFMIDNTVGMDAKQRALVAAFPSLLHAMRSASFGQADPAGPPCTAADTSNCRLPDLHIGVIDSNLGAGLYTFTTCEQPGGDLGHLLGTPGALARTACATPQQPWISYSTVWGVPVTNVEHAASADPLVQLAEAFACIAPRGINGCGFEHQLEATRRALSPGANDGFLRPGSMLAIVLLTDEDDCSARRTELFDPTQQGIDDPLGPLSSFRCTEFGVICTEKLRAPGVKHNCQPGLDYLYSLDGYTAFLLSLRPPGRLLLAAIGGPVQPFDVALDGSSPALKPSCASTVGTGVPGIRLQALTRAFGAFGIYNAGLVGSTPVEVNICSPDLTPAMNLIGSKIAAQL